MLTDSLATCRAKSETPQRGIGITSFCALDSVRGVTTNARTLRRAVRRVCRQLRRTLDAGAMERADAVAILSGATA
jgi:hypothetical protein